LSLSLLTFDFSRELFGKQHLSPTTRKIGMPLLVNGLGLNEGAFRLFD
jgi:hypothetical protein